MPELLVGTKKGLFVLSGDGPGSYRIVTRAFAGDVVEYAIRVNQSGHFLLPPTRVAALYAPETFGEIPNAPVDVVR